MWPDLVKDRLMLLKNGKLDHILIIWGVRHRTAARGQWIVTGAAAKEIVKFYEVPLPLDDYGVVLINGSGEHTLINKCGGRWVLNWPAYTVIK